VFFAVAGRGLAGSQKPEISGDGVVVGVIRHVTDFDTLGVPKIFTQL